MRIRLKAVMAGPKGSFQPGEVLDLPDPEARALIAGEYAELVESAVDAPAETAVAPLTAETAALAPPQVRRRRGA